MTPRPVVLHRLTTGRGPRVLLLHGMADSVSIWDKLSALAPHRKALHQAEFFAVELPWRGTGPAGWGYRAEPSAWLAEALDTLAAAEGPADVVVGHSFAAMLLLDLLCGPAAPDLRGIVLVSPYFRARPEDFDWATMTGLPEKFVLAMEEGIRLAAGARTKPVLHRAMAERLCEFIGPYGWARFFESYLRTPWLRTENLTAPALVVSGTGDRIAATAEAAALAERLPTATLRTVEDAGHFPMTEQPEQFADLLDEFLQRPVPVPGPAGKPPHPTPLERI